MADWNWDLAQAGWLGEPVECEAPGKYCSQLHQMNKKTSPSDLSDEFCSAIERVLIAVVIEIVTRKRRKSAKFRLAEKNADLNSLKLKTSIKKIHKVPSMSNVRTAFNDKDSAERRSIVCGRKETVERNSGKCRKCFRESEEKSATR